MSMSSKPLCEAILTFKGLQVPAPKIRTYDLGALFMRTLKENI